MLLTCGIIGPILDVIGHASHDVSGSKKRASILVKSIMVIE